MDGTVGCGERLAAGQALTTSYASSVELIEEKSDWATELTGLNTRAISLVVPTTRGLRRILGE